ncbi:peptidase domain-containing ABC transporter [Rhizobium sp. BK377]|uniref:peptidase domain-containing ABC transporter n=1 Tax=Rhizobium sp. BK377 TaxID=2587058 RepID=UPI0016179B2F|nr:peptidase domain-containing ABC transporter [Rhizobium sp. BK377]MBB3462911.1 ATP-binding cassette subfamily B protein RaxB [Rhizobium sp. BK377]
MNSTALQSGFLSSARVRLIRQTEVSECGLACLAMIAGFYGRSIDLATMRRRFTPSLRGAPLSSLIKIADQIGLTPRAVKLPLEQIPNLALPAVLHWDMNHYVIAERVTGDRILIHDPAGRTEWLRTSEVSGHFTGVALELRPNETFERMTERETLRWSQLWSHITGLASSFVQVLVLSLVLQVYILALPYYLQISIDTALPALDRDLLSVLAMGFGLFTLFNAAATFLRSFVILAAGSSLGFGIAANIARKLFRLPLDWFQKREVGDVLSRFQSVAPIQKMLSEGIAATLVDGVLALTTLVIMFFYSVKLALVAVTAFFLYFVVRFVSFSLERRAQEGSIIAHSKEQTALIETIRGIQTFRLYNRESMRHSMWQTLLTDAVNANIRVSRVGIWQSTANALIFGLENIVTVWLAVGFVMQGGFSVGMVFAYMAYKSQFLEKTGNLVDQATAFFMLRLHLERLSDIALEPDDRSFGTSENTVTELKGAIALKGVSYRYSQTDPLVLSGVNLTVSAGEHIAITGPSGSGKTTLLKLMIGLLEPNAGELMIDGLPLSQFGHKSFHNQIAAVLQDDNLFAGSIADNIALFDERPDQAAIVAAAQAAAIHDEIMATPMQYETLVGDMGSSLSGGQKQRVLLARALYRKPKMLFLDEGTSHMDVANEARVNASVKALGITRIVVAHRLETIVSADRVFYLDDNGLAPVERKHLLQPSMSVEGRSGNGGGANAHTPSHAMGVSAKWPAD